MSATFASWAAMPGEGWVILGIGLLLTGMPLALRWLAGRIDARIGAVLAAGDRADVAPGPAPVPLARAAAEVARPDLDRLGLADAEGRN